MFVVDCMIWTVGVRVRVLTSCLEHKKLDVVY